MQQDLQKNVVREIPKIIFVYECFSESLHNIQEELKQDKLPDSQSALIELKDLEDYCKKRIDFSLDILEEM